MKGDLKKDTLKEFAVGSNNDFLTSKDNARFFDIFILHDFTELEICC